MCRHASAVEAVDVTHITVWNVAFILLFRQEKQFLTKALLLL